MRTHKDIPKVYVPNVLPLWVTPWWLRLIGYPEWRWMFDGDWVYVTVDEYNELFGR